MIDSDDARAENPRKRDLDEDELVADGRPSLTDEQREIANGGRVREKQPDRPSLSPSAAAKPREAELAGAIKELGELIEAQKASNRIIATQLEDMVDEMHGILDEIAEIKQNSLNVEHSARQAAIDGVNKAQHEAREITLRNIRETATKCTDSIDTMVDESKRRIERLARITLPDKLFNYGKWLALLLVLVILCHVVWQLTIG